MSKQALLKNLHSLLANKILKNSLDFVNTVVSSTTDTWNQRTHNVEAFSMVLKVCSYNLQEVARGLGQPGPLMAAHFGSALDWL